MCEVNSCCGNLPEPNKIGKIIRELNSAFKKNFIACGTAAGLDEVTLMHGWIMGYLAHNQDKAIYQKGYIRREAVEGDARLKRIFLTEQGKETAARTKTMIEQIDSSVIRGIGEEELEVFCGVARKLLSNMHQ